MCYENTAKHVILRLSRMATLVKPTILSFAIEEKTS